jgi:hypothetical protein
LGPHQIIRCTTLAAADRIGPQVELVKINSWMMRCADLVAHLAKFLRLETLRPKTSGDWLRR